MSLAKQKRPLEADLGMMGTFLRHYQFNKKCLYDKQLSDKDLNI